MFGAVRCACNGGEVVLSIDVDLDVCAHLPRAHSVDAAAAAGLPGDGTVAVAVPAVAGAHGPGGDDDLVADGAEGAAGAAGGGCRARGPRTRGRRCRCGDGGRLRAGGGAGRGLAAEAVLVDGEAATDRGGVAAVGKVAVVAGGLDAGAGLGAHPAVREADARGAGGPRDTARALAGALGGVVVVGGLGVGGGDGEEGEQEEDGEEGRGAG